MTTLTFRPFVATGRHVLRSSPSAWTRGWGVNVPWSARKHQSRPNPTPGVGRSVCTSGTRNSRMLRGPLGWFVIDGSKRSVCFCWAATLPARTWGDDDPKPAKLEHKPEREPPDSDRCPKAGSEFINQRRQGKHRKGYHIQECCARKIGPKDITREILRYPWSMAQKGKGVKKYNHGKTAWRRLRNPLIVCYERENLDSRVVRFTRPTVI